MAVNRSYSNTSQEYSVTYDGMRGVDFSKSTDGVCRYRFSDMQNMYKDYEGRGDGCVESIPGFRKIISLKDGINSLFSQRTDEGEYIVVHAGESLYRVPLGAKDRVLSPEAIISLKNTKSQAFTFGSDLYILDGEKIIKLFSDGTADYVGEEGRAKPYIPTTYYNGAEYEQRNLLSDLFIEKYLISVASDMSLGSELLTYKITSTEDMLCAVTGISDGYEGEVYIPSFAVIGGKAYRVTEIMDGAFKLNHKITRVVLSESVLRVGKDAFSHCTSLIEVVFSDGCRVIESGVLSFCDRLMNVYFGRGLEKISPGAFSSCSALTMVYYPLTEEEFSSIDNDAGYDDPKVYYGVSYRRIAIEVPIKTPTSELVSVELDGNSVEYTVKESDGQVIAVVIESDGSSSLDGSLLTVLGRISSEKGEKSTHGVSFLGEFGDIISPKEAILGCTVAESFDGRVFLSGNSRIPNTVFYSARDGEGKNNPLYFGALNYFNDGVGSFGVVSMLAAQDSLLVFKEGDDGTGSIFYHTPKETGIDIIPKIYPVSYFHNGVAATGPSASFFDDSVFISRLGLTALSKKEINLERSIAVRSNNVNRRLLGENLSEALLAKWRGYLVLSVSGNMYLANSRERFSSPSGYEYEWYFLSGIGTYRDDRGVFMYSERAPEGFSVKSDMINAETDEDVYLSRDGNGNTVYFTNEYGTKYAVYSEGEKRGGVFSPATSLHSINDEFLLFGTANGDVCIFNSDMRGEPPPYLLDSEEFDAIEYRERFYNKIHPYYYSFNSHAPRYLLKTPSDNGGIAYLSKSTVKNSLTVKFLFFDNSSFTVEAGTETGYSEINQIPSSSVSFEDMNFASLSFFLGDYMLLTLGEREKGWVEKSINFYSERFNSPFGIASISYRFKIKGKIKY